MIELGIFEIEKRKKRTCSDLAAGGVKVHVDGFGGVFGFEEEELGDDDVSSIVVDGSVYADDPFLEETRENVVSSLTTGRVLDHHRYKTVVSVVGTGQGGHGGGGGGGRNEPFGG